MYDVHGNSYLATGPDATHCPDGVSSREGAVSRWSWSATLTVVHTVSATTSLPYEHVERATAGLRAKLRYKLLDLGTAPDWSTLKVSGPVTTIDGMGRPWFEYRVRAEPRRVRPRPPRVAAAFHSDTPLAVGRGLDKGPGRDRRSSTVAGQCRRPADMASMWWSVVSR
jgi:hypothetical protein